MHRSTLCGLSLIAAACASNGSDADDVSGKADGGETVLALGEPVKVSGATGDTRTFKFVVPADFKFTRISFRLDNPDGDADVWGKLGSPAADEDDADFHDHDEQTSASDCFWQACSHNTVGLVDREVVWDVPEVEPGGVYFVTIQGSDGYAQEIDQGLAEEPIRPEFRDRFNGTLVVNGFDDTALNGQDIALEMEMPLPFFAKQIFDTANLRFEVPSSAVALTVKVAGEGTFIVNLTPPVDVSGAPPRGSQYVTHSNLSMRATSGSWTGSIRSDTPGLTAGWIKISADPALVPEDAVLNGIAHTSLSGKAGEVLTLYFDVPQTAEDLRVELTGGTGDADLFVWHNPNPIEHDQAQRSTSSGNNELVQFDPIGGERYRIQLFGRSNFANVTMKATLLR
jgi:hypothetical protein